MAFRFVDETLISSLRCCDVSGRCVDLGSGNVTSLNVSQCFETGASQMNINFWNTLVGNPKLLFAVFGFFVLLGVSLYVVRRR